MAWAVGAPILMVLGLAVAWVMGVPWALGPIVGGVLAAGWVSGMWLAYRVFDSMRGPMLALLGHLIFFVYLTVVGIVMALLRAMMEFEWMSVIATAPLLALALVAGYFARRAERWIAEQCIGEYLRRQSLVSGAPVSQTP